MDSTLLNSKTIKMRLIKLLSLAMIVVSATCTAKPLDSGKFMKENVNFSKKQINKEIKMIEKSGKLLNPTTLKKDGTVFYCDYTDWRSGFFPGSVWYLYQLTKDKTYLPLAKKYSKAIEEAKNITWNHDVGFMIGCSFGNGYKLTKDPEYKDIIIQTAKSLSTRFRKVPGIIQSWDADKGWQAQRGWQCPVIIDNMMNLELLFEATRLSGDSTYYKIAVSHANRTLAEHFRPDGSCYHVVDYSMVDGSVRHRQTAQGYSDESVWSRGQAWAIYGFAVCYRETGNPVYLNQALKTFAFMKNHPRLPKDLIPYWDMDAPKIPDEPRDVSSAACIASALYEISTFDIPNASSYKLYADRILYSLGTPAYRAKLGTNGNFLLMHSVGSIPHNSEINVPLNYADYYFLEALSRKKNIEAK